MHSALSECCNYDLYQLYQSQTHINLIIALFIHRFALDLVEVFFQICHTRLPLLNPSQFRAQLKYSLPSPTLSPRHPPADKPLHPALLATVIAWGAKFSEHPLLVADREGAGGQSRLARTLVSRAREVAEAEKVHRISSVDHVVIALLIEPLQNRKKQFYPLLPKFMHVSFEHRKSRKS